MGILDNLAVSAAAAYSFRKLRDAYSGNCIRVRRSSDNTEQDIGFNSSLELDASSLLSFVGAGDGFIKTWYDQSGNAINATQSTNTTQPYIVRSGAITKKNGRTAIWLKGNGESREFSVARFFSTPSTEFHISLVASEEVRSPVLIFVLNRGSPSIAGYTTYSGSLIFECGGTSGSFVLTSSGSVTVGQMYAYGFVNSVTGTRQQIRQDKVVRASDATGHSVAIDATNYIGGYGGNYYHNGYLSEFIAFQSALSTSKAEELENDQIRRYVARHIVFDGNSLTAGQAADRRYPDKVSTLLGETYTFENFGVGGQTCAQMITDAATQVDTKYRASRPKNICVAWEGTNDLYYGASAATALANLKSYCASRRAAGWYVIVLTVLPSSEAGMPVDFDSKRQSINSGLRDAAEIGVSWDAVADVAADSRIGDSGDETNTTYYTDLTHMTSAGYQIVADIVAAKILAIPSGTTSGTNLLMGAA